MSTQCYIDLGMTNHIGKLHYLYIQASVFTVAAKLGGYVRVDVYSVISIQNIIVQYKYIITVYIYII